MCRRFRWALDPFHGRLRKMFSFSGEWCQVWWPFDFTSTRLTSCSFAWWHKEKNYRRCSPRFNFPSKGNLIFSDWLDRTDRGRYWFQFYVNMSLCSPCWCFDFSFSFLPYRVRSLIVCMWMRRSLGGEDLERWKTRATACTTAEACTARNFINFLFGIFVYAWLDSMGMIGWYGP